MGKVLNAYRGFTATAIKTRADIPAAGDMNIDGTTVICENIDFSDIKKVIGASTYNLSDLCTSTGVNLWSGFCPVVRSVTGATVWVKQLVNSAPTGEFKAADFAGYNHGAVTPGWGTGGKAAAQADIWINSDSKATFISDIVVGEVNYPSSDGLVLCAIDSASGIAAWSRVTIDDIADTASLTCESTNNLTLEESFTLRSYVVNANTITTANDIDDAIICRVPNVDDATVTVKIKAASTWYYDQTGTQTIPSPWVQNGAAGMNWTSGYFDIGSILANQNYTGLRVYATLFNWLNKTIGSGNLFNGNYTANQSITGSVYLGMAPIANYGYRVVVYFEVDA